MMIKFINMHSFVFLYTYFEQRKNSFNFKKNSNIYFYLSLTNSLIY